MAGGSAIYLGKTGATGGVTGAHGHFEVIKDGKRFGLSQARADLGQNIQFRLPNEQAWQQMYSPVTGGQFRLNPAIGLTEGIGIRAVHPVTGAKNVAHQGEDYSFPEGTDLRFMGGGNVQGLQNVGRAGNISTLRTGPYKLDMFHMSKLPGAASAPESMRVPEAPVLPGGTPATEDTRTKDILEAFMYGTQYQQPQKEKTLADTLKGELITGALTNALAPRRSFLSSFIGQQPYLMGQAVSTSDYLAGYPV
jgi:hypothetical protein